jgi:hypothetical protein
MLRRVVLACAVLLAFASFSAAEAGIPIPCTAVHFLKAPDVSGTSGQGIALYYQVGCWGASWDGYYTANGKYIPIPQAVLSSLPPPPGFWASAWEYKLKFWVEWLWVFLAAFVVFGTLLSKWAGVKDSDFASPAANPQTTRRR